MEDFFKNNPNLFANINQNRNNNRNLYTKSQDKIRGNMYRNDRFPNKNNIEYMNNQFGNNSNKGNLPRPNIFIIGKFGKKTVVSQDLKTFMNSIKEAEWTTNPSYLMAKDIKVKPVFSKSNIEVNENIPNYSNGVISFSKQIIEKKIGKKGISVLPAYHNYLWEKISDYSITDSISVNIPIFEIVDFFKLKMTNPGFWCDNSNNIVCADYRYCKNSNVDGLYMRKEYFSSFLKKKRLTAVWVGLGEKIHQDGYDVVGFNELSSLVYIDVNGEIKSYNISNHNRS